MISLCSVWVCIWNIKRGDKMRNIKWIGKELCFENSNVSIYGENVFFCDALENLIIDKSSEHIINCLPKKLNILVFVGMTLPKVFGWVIASRQKYNKKKPFIIFCDKSCARMLAGTKGYEQVLFIGPEKTTSQIQHLIHNWLNIKKGKKTERVINLKNIRDVRIMNMISQGRVVANEAQRTGHPEKTIYTWLYQFSERIGAHSRQELYLKTRLIMNDKKPQQL